MMKMLYVFVPLGLFFLVQLYYYMICYLRLWTHNKTKKVLTSKQDASDMLPPISVIVVAENMAGKLEKNLSQILEQEYPNFEVVVVYNESSFECETLLHKLQKQYANLRCTFSPDSRKQLSHRKLAVSLGMKASRNDWLVFTDPRCHPASNQWLRHMATNFSLSTSVVLGYCNYEPTAGWYSKRIRFDCFLHNVRFLSMALCGHPFMGLGFNLAYHRDMYNANHGFSRHLNLERGEDDVFISEIAESSNTRIEIHPESVMYIDHPEYKHTWHEEKTSRAITQRYLKRFGKYFARFDTISRMLLYLSTAIAMAAGIMWQQWLFVYVAAGLLLLHFCIQLMVLHAISNSLNDKVALALLPYWNIAVPIFDLWCRLITRHRNA